MLRCIRVTPFVSRTKPARTMSSLPGAPSSWDNVVAPPSKPTASSSSIEEPPQKLPEEFASLTDSPPSSSLPAAAEADSGPPTGTAYGAPNPPPPNPNASLNANPFATLKHLSKNRPYSLYVTATRNNTIATFTRPGGEGLATFTGGKCGFKGQKRAGFEAGYQCAMRVFESIKKEKERLPLGAIHLEVFLSGFGQGRDAVFKALMSGEGQLVRGLVSRVTDRTPIKVGGTRAKKMRRG